MPLSSLLLSFMFPYAFDLESISCTPLSFQILLKASLFCEVLLGLMVKQYSYFYPGHSGLCLSPFTLNKGDCMKVGVPFTQNVRYSFSKHHRKTIHTMWTGELGTRRNRLHASLIGMVAVSRSSCWVRTLPLMSSREIRVSMHIM